MNFPPGGSAIVATLYNRNLDLARGTDDQRRQLTKLMAQTIAARIGPRWGTKATSKTAPQSKDSIAYDNMDGTFDSWDWQNGTTKFPQISDGQPPTYPRIANQYFINVEPHDWLVTEPSADPPAAPAPPQRDEQLERLIDAVQRAAGELDVMNASLTTLNVSLELIIKSGVRVHL